MSDIIAKYNTTVRLAEQIRKEETGLSQKTTMESEAFREKEESFEKLYEKETVIKRKFNRGLWVFGIFFGLVIMLKTLILHVKRIKQDYEPDRFHCLSCGRCMEYCPVPEVSGSGD